MSRIGLFGQISEINDHLYLSGAGVLRPEKIKQKKITCVINASTEEPNAYLPGVDCIKISIEDNPYARLDHYFDMVADKIRSVKERGGRTLVHCVAGVSRSATLCIIYLLKYERMSLRQAYHYVKSARPIVRPNVGFWKQMVDYERKHRGHSTVSMIPVENSALPFPDVYSNDLRKHMLSHPVPPQKDPLVIAQQKQSLNRNNGYNNNSSNGATSNGKSSTIFPGTKIIPIDFSGKRRGLSVGTMDSTRNRHSAHISGGNSSNTSHYSNSGGSNSMPYNPWHASISLLSPAPNRRSSTHHNKHENIFGNIYNSSREAFFPAF